MFYHPDICEVPDAIPFPLTFTQETSEQPLITQAALPFHEALKGPSQTSDQG